MSPSTAEPLAPPPPPPPEPPPGAGDGPRRPSRATAATWVSATGALLLLAAAGTFLAVQWETMGLPARVAVVAAVTGAAILGGHRLQRLLPAVGAVVFHLGALLIPVDALGLAFQLDASPAARWIAVGATTVVVLPVLAVAGRSLVLGWGAVAGVPVLATGLGLVAAPPAPVLVAGSALAVVVFAGPSVQRWRSMVVPAGTALAVVAVFAPLLAAALVASPADSGTLEQLRAAGWEPTSWLLVLAAVALAVAAMAVATHRERSPRLAALTLTSAVVGASSVVVPTAPPESVLVVFPAAVFLLLQALAASVDDEPWDGPARRLASAAEVVSILALVPLLAIGVVLAHVSYSGDGPRALALALLALGWGVAAWRRSGRGGRDARWPLVAATSAAAVLHLALAAIVGGTGVVPAAVVLLAGAGATIVWRPVGGVAGRGDQVTTWVTAASAGTGLGLVALLIALRSPAALAVLVGIAVTAGLHVRASTPVAADRRVAATLWLLAPVTFVGVLAGATATANLYEPTAPWVAGAAAIALLAMGSLSAAQPAVAHSARSVAAVVGFLTTSAALRSLLGTDAWIVAEVVELGVEALLPAGIVAAWLLVEVASLRQPVVACLAVPAGVRLVASALLVGGVGTRTTGLTIVALGVASGLAAAFGLRRWTWPAAVLTGAAGVIGVPLVDLTPELRAVMVVAVGLVVAVAGLARHRPVVAHVGGVVAIAGSWQLFALREVGSLDVWVLPLALHLWLAGRAARRRHGVSSWFADVPPLLLIAVPALVERAAGGSGWHAVLAGGLAVVVVAAGGNARLGGPLVIGTVVLVAVVGIEVFAVVAVVPTWIWLAIGGAGLLGAGAAMELVDGTPVTALRRLVRIVDERFD